MSCDGRAGSLQRKKQPGRSWWSDCPSSKGITDISDLKNSLRFGRVWVCSVSMWIDWCSLYEIYWPSHEDLKSTVIILLHIVVSKENYCFLSVTFQVSCHSNPDFNSWVSTDTEMKVLKTVGQIPQKLCRQFLGALFAPKRCFLCFRQTFLSSGDPGRSNNSIQVITAVLAL